jgi:hypothetical protein
VFGCLRSSDCDGVTAVQLQTYYSFHPAQKIMAAYFATKGIIPTENYLLKSLDLK